MLAISKMSDRFLNLTELQMLQLQRGIFKNACVGV